MGFFSKNKTAEQAEPFVIVIDGRQVGRASTKETAIRVGESFRKSFTVLRDGRQVFAHTKG